MLEKQDYIPGTVSEPAEMIDIRNLTRKFADLTAVEDLTFTVRDGEIFGLLGPNGAGKTTTIRMICCLIAPTSGTVHIGDLSAGNKEDKMAIRKKIGLVPDNVGLYESFTAIENLEYFARLYEVPASQMHENIEKYLRMFDLWTSRDKPVGAFSKGMKQKVSVARALIHNPEIMIMDEPTANLDPEATKTIRDMIVDLKNEGKTILLNTHNLDEAQKICSRIGILKKRLLAVDTPVNLEKSISSGKVVILLEQVTDSIMSVVNGIDAITVSVVGNKLELELKDPERETPVVVEKIVAAGGRILSVSNLTASLEDVYLKMVREE